MRRNLGVIDTLAATGQYSEDFQLSTATIFVRTPGDVGRVRDGGSTYAAARANTYASLARSTSVAARVITDLGG